jgi:hypothetical protein
MTYKYTKITRLDYFLSFDGTTYSLWQYEPILRKSNGTSSSYFYNSTKTDPVVEWNREVFELLHWNLRSKHISLYRCYIKWGKMYKPSKSRREPVTETGIERIEGEQK